MRSKLSAGTVVVSVAFSCVLGCITLALANGPDGLASPKVPFRAVPVRENALPYNAYGVVTILDDGTLIVEVGGQESVRYTSTEDGDEEELLTTPWDVIAYQLDLSGLAIIEHRGQVFLDKNGKQLRDRGLSSNQVFATAFPRRADIDAGADRYAVISFAGELDLSFDPKGSRLRLTVTDSEETGRVFSFTGRIMSSGTPATDEDADVVLLTQETEVSSDCSVSCQRGSSVISCTDSGCKCYCKVGKPKCDCVNSAH